MERVVCKTNHKGWCELKNRKLSYVVLFAVIVSVLGAISSTLSLQNSSVLLATVEKKSTAVPAPTLATYFSQSAVLFVSVNGAEKLESTFLTQAVVVDNVPLFQINVLALGEAGDFIYFATPIGETYGYHSVTPDTNLSGSITVNGVQSELIGDITVTNDSILVNAKDVATNQSVIATYKVEGINPDKKVDPVFRFSTPSPKV